MPDFKGWEYIYDHNHWTMEWYLTAMIIGWVWSIVLLVINIVMIALGKDQVDSVSG